MTEQRRITDKHPDRPLDWSDTEALAGQQWRAPAASPSPLPALQGQQDELLAEALNVFDAMLDGCNEQKFGDFQNGHGEEIGPRMDALHAKLRASSPATTQQAESQEGVTYKHAESFAADYSEIRGEDEEGRDAVYTLTEHDHWIIKNFLIELFEDAPGAAAPASAEPVQVPDWISYDESRDVLTIHGLKYSGELFRNLGIAPVGESFTVIDSKDGVLTLARLAPSSTPVESVDTPQLQAILFDLSRAETREEWTPAEAALITHINQHCARVAKEAREEAVVAAALAASEAETATMVVYGKLLDDAIQTRENILSAILALRAPQAAGTEQEKK